MKARELSNLRRPLPEHELRMIGEHDVWLIPLDKCAELLDDATAVILFSENGAPVTYPAVLFEASDPEGCLAEIQWDDEKGQGFCVTFEGEDNPDGGIFAPKKGTLWLRDTDHALQEIGLLSRHVENAMEYIPKAVPSPMAHVRVTRVGFDSAELTLPLLSDEEAMQSAIWSAAANHVFGSEHTSRYILESIYANGQPIMQELWADRHAEDFQ